MTIKQPLARLVYFPDDKAGDDPVDRNFYAEDGHRPLGVLEVIVYFR